MEGKQFKFNFFGKDKEEKPEMKIVREDSPEYTGSLEERRVKLAKECGVLPEKIVFTEESDNDVPVEEKEARVVSSNISYSIEDWKKMFNNEEDWYK